MLVQWGHICGDSMLAFSEWLTFVLPPKMQKRMAIYQTLFSVPLYQAVCASSGEGNSLLLVPEESSHPRTAGSTLWVWLPTVVLALGLLVAPQTSLGRQSLACCSPAQALNGA